MCTHHPHLDCILLLNEFRERFHSSVVYFRVRFFFFLFHQYSSFAHAPCTCNTVTCYHWIVYYWQFIKSSQRRKKPKKNTKKSDLATEPKMWTLGQIIHIHIDFGLIQRGIQSAPFATVSFAEHKQHRSRCIAANSYITKRFKSNDST